jgi:hypothetical protein
MVTCPQCHKELRNMPEFLANSPHISCGQSCEGLVKVSLPATQPSTNGKVHVEPATTGKGEDAA